MDWPTISAHLQQEGLLSASDSSCTPLTGGVSSDIYLIKDGPKRYVIKQALAKLKVEDDWEADLSRNQVEQDFIHLADKLLPGTVPRILFSDSSQGFFIMEYLDESFINWKTQLLAGDFDESTTRRVANILAGLHSKTRGDTEVASGFDTTANFKGLRIDPYLVTTGNRNPTLRSLFLEEAHRLENHREALVHGDYSPKNILVGPDRVVLLDH